MHLIKDEATGRGSVALNQTMASPLWPHHLLDEQEDRAGREHDYTSGLHFGRDLSYVRLTQRTS